MNNLWLLLIPYCTLAFGIHGGEFLQGINRPVRNLLCALPFGLAVCHAGYPDASVVAFLFAYVGVNMGFDNWPLWIKGFVTFPPLGAVLLPLAYRIGNRTRWTNVVSEYLSGTLYGIVLYIIAA